MSLLAAIASMPWPAQAMNWQVLPRASVAETYTDNVNLRPSDQAHSDWITELRPGFDIYGRGARATVNLNYTLDAILSATGTGHNKIFHQLNAKGNAVLIQQHLFVDASALSTQQLTNLLGPVGINNTTATSNITQVTALSVSPYLTNHFGSFADSTLRYTHDRVWDNTSTTSESHTNSEEATLKSGDAFGPLEWTLDASHRRTQFTGGLGSGTFNQASGRLGYRLSPHWLVSTTGGYEHDQYQSFRSMTGGKFWDVGVKWVPNQRASLEVRYGHRFFGKTGSLNLSYRRRAALLQASYTQEITSQRSVVLANAGTIPVFSPSCPPSNPTCTPITQISVFRTQAVNDFFVLRLGQASMSLFSPRQRVTLAYTLLRETFERDGTQARQEGVDLSWYWQAAVNTHFTADTGWTRNQPERTNRKDDLWHVLAGVIHSLGPRTEVSLRYRHQGRISNSSSAEYDENAIIAELFWHY